MCNVQCRATPTQQNRNTVRDVTNWIKCTMKTVWGTSRYAVSFRSCLLPVRWMVYTSGIMFMLMQLLAVVWMNKTKIRLSLCITYVVLTFARTYALVCVYCALRSSFMLFSGRKYVRTHSIYSARNKHMHILCEPKHRHLNKNKQTHIHTHTTCGCREFPSLV